MNQKLKNTVKNRWNFVGIFTCDFKCVSVCGCVRMLVWVIIFTNPSARAGYDIRSIFKRSLTGLNSEFSFSQTSCLTKAEEPNLSSYLPIAWGRIIGFIPFPRVLVLCEMHSIRSRIWTRVAVSISCDDNHYTTDTYCVGYCCVLMCACMDLSEDTKTACCFNRI